MPRITINQKKCNQCGACWELCNSSDVYEHIDQRVQVTKPENCWFCGHCIAVCPTDAIAHSEFPLTECSVIDPALLPSLDSLVAAFQERRSTRVFKNKPVSREIVRELVDISRCVPSAANAQSVDWLTIDDSAMIAELSEQVVAVFDHTLRENSKNVSMVVEDIEDFKRLVQQLSQGKDPIFFKAPVLLIAHVPVENSFGRDDATYAAYNLLLAAERMGLGTCLIGYFIYALESSNKLLTMFKLPEDRRIEVALVLGYPKYKFKRAIPRRRMEITWNSMKNDL